MKKITMFCAQFRPTSSTSSGGFKQRLVSGFKRIGSARYASRGSGPSSSEAAFKRSGSLRRSGRGSTKRDPSEVLRLKRVRRAKANDRERNRSVSSKWKTMVSWKFGTEV